MKNTVVNVHIPKTAGTTFRSQFRFAMNMHDETSTVFGIDNAAQRHGDYFQILREEFEEALAEVPTGNLNLISGHYRYRDVADLVQPLRYRVFVATFVRDPIARVLSDYFYSISDKHPASAQFRAQFPDLESYLAIPGQTAKQLDYLRPFDGASVDQTLASLPGNFDFVGVTEYIDEDLAEVTSMFGLKCPPPRELNKGPGGRGAAEARETYRDLLQDRLRDDIALYEGILEQRRQGRGRHSAAVN